MVLLAPSNSKFRVYAWKIGFFFWLYLLTNWFDLMIWMQAARIIAQVLVMGSGILVRAVAQAYRQAITSTFSFLGFFYRPM